MLLKYMATISVLLILISSVSVFGQNCENAENELESAMSASSSTDQIDQLVRLLQRCPDFSKGLNNLGVLLEEQGNLKDASELYRRAIHTDQRFPYPYVGLGDIYFQQKEYSLAATMYKEALNMYQQSAIIQNNYPNLESDIPRIKDRLNQCQAAMPVATRGMKVVTSDVIESQLKEEPTGLTRGIHFKTEIRPKIALTINFEYNSAQISEVSVSQIEEIGKALCSDSLKTCIISIEGHADATGNDEYNKRLSEKRSASVKQLLSTRYGIDDGRLKTVGYGESRPIDSNDSEAGRAANRRVELVNMGKL